MPRSAKVALTDILSAIDLAREAAFDMPFDEFEHHSIRRAATERALLIISEAVRHLPEDIILRNSNLQWQDMKGIGNRLRHEYWMIDAKIIWEVVQHDLDDLQATIRKELALL